MSNTQSKVLILEDCNEAKSSIKQFSEKNNLIAVTSHLKDAIEILKSYVDLGAVFISETYQVDALSGLDLAAEIHHIRPELPLYFRCQASTVDLYKNIFLNKGVCCAYELTEIGSLEDQLKSNIFNQDYPNALLRGIEEIAHESLLSIFDEVEIDYSAPYLVKDRIIYGELLSLIPIESSWCKGFMMLQANHENLFKYISPSISDKLDKDNFRSVNDILSELTNMMWGGLRARFITDNEPRHRSNTEIPIIINHANNYITFGTNTPHLCLQYTLRSKSDPSSPVTLFQKFIFNINWAPEHFKDKSTSADALIESGELEFF